MILTKQLDLPQYLGEYSYVSPTTPRTNRAKELEKYNRPPPADFFSGKPIAPKPKDGATGSNNSSSSSATSADGITATSTPYSSASSNLPDRPNILSKRQNYRPQYRYEPQGPMNLSVKVEPDGTFQPPGGEGIDLTLDLSIKKAGSSGQRPTVLVNPQMHEDMQDEPMDFSTKAVGIQSPAITQALSHGSPLSSVSHYSSTPLQSPSQQGSVSSLHMMP